MSDPHKFSVRDWLRDDKPRVQEFARPRQVGCWTKQSITEGGHYLYGDNSGLPVFQQPRCPGLDLNAGYPSNYIKKPVEVEGTPVEHIIRAAQQAGVNCSQAQVVTFRNNLNKITQTPLAGSKPEDGWVVDACSHGGTLFLDIVPKEERPFPNADVFCYYGYHFEAACTGSDVVDATSEYAAVLRLRLGGLHVLMGAEIDCCDPPAPAAAGQPPAEPHYLELKTYKLPANEWAHKQLVKNKHPGWWVQSFLAGTPTLVLGGRDASGILQEVTRVDVASLPSRSAAAGQPFDAWQLLRFSEAILGWMCGCAAGSAGGHIRFEFRPAERVVTCVLMNGGPLPGRIDRALGAGAGLGAGLGPLSLKEEAPAEAHGGNGGGGGREAGEEGRRHPRGQEDQEEAGALGGQEEGEEQEEEEGEDEEGGAAPGDEGGEEGAGEEEGDAEEGSLSGGAEDSMEGS